MKWCKTIKEGIMSTSKSGIPIAVVYETYDYDMFKRMEENRNVTEQRTEKLLASFSEKEILNPIIINEKFEIIDGQGRYEALKRLGRPIKYIISPEADIEDCRRMNRYNKAWTVDDWVESYSRNPDPSIQENYRNLKECCKKYNVSYIRAFSLSGRSDRGKINSIHEGRAVFTKKDIETVGSILGKGDEIMNVLLSKKRPNEAFWKAIKVITQTEGYDHNRMLKNCTSLRSSYNQMSNLEAQLAEFSRIYNHRAKGDKLYFEDYMRNRGYNVRNYDTCAGVSKHDYEDVSTLRRE
jgi:ribulose bisphosphate carboxylase small subunit